LIRIAVAKTTIAISRLMTTVVAIPVADPELKVEPIRTAFTKTAANIR
jgi:hypothetical protein